jgi:hypothetical protein
MAINRASDKLDAFETWFSDETVGVEIPAFTIIQAEAQAWSDAGETTFGRTRRGFKGRGITIYPPGSAVGVHELYTKGIQTTREYRLHVVGGEVIRVQRKYPTVVGSESAWIKNHAAGFVFRQPRQALHQNRIRMAIAATKALGLDFGAVDMVIDNGQREYILEINTAPACSPLTATAYVNALASLIQERSNGAYIPNVGFNHLSGLRPEGEVVDEARAAVLAFA